MFINRDADIKKCSFDWFDIDHVDKGNKTCDQITEKKAVGDKNKGWGSFKGGEREIHDVYVSELLSWDIDLTYSKL